MPIINRTDGWNPRYVDGLKSIIHGSFIPIDAIEEEQIADTEKWVLDDIEILKEVPNANDIEFVMLEEIRENLADRLKEIHRHLREQKVIGLVVMGNRTSTDTMVNRYTKPSAIVLTTRDKFYVINPTDRTGVKFLQFKLHDPELEFFTTDGLNEADCLWRHLGINLKRSMATDCAGVHIHLMQSMRYLCNAALAIYPDQLKYKCRGKLRIERFSRLVDIWLNLDDFALDIQNRNQLRHIKLNPLNLTTRNLILKRCLLVRPLALRLKMYSELEARLISEMNHRRLTDFYYDDKLAKEAARKVYKTLLFNENHKQQRQRMQFAHLDEIQFQLGSPARYYQED